MNLFFLLLLLLLLLLLWLWLLFFEIKKPSLSSSWVNKRFASFATLELKEKRPTDVLKQDEAHNIRQLVVLRRYERRQLVVEIEHDYIERTREIDEREVGEREEREYGQTAEAARYVFGDDLEIDDQAEKNGHVESELLA